VDGVTDGVLRVRVSAPPVDGAANRALTSLLADTLGVPVGAVRIVSGETARTKLVQVDGLTQGAIEARWPGVRC